MKKIAFITRTDAHSQEIAAKLQAILKDSSQITVDVESPDLVLVVGGDGTYIRAVHHYETQLDTVSFVGVHTGTLGFFCDYQESEAEDLAQAILHTEPTIENTSLLAFHSEHTQGLALNEVRIENIHRTQEMNILIDGQPFESFRGTGLLVSTAVGSTAYNRSLGGAILAKGIEGLEMVEIAGIHHTAYRSLGVPIVFPPETKIEFSSEDYQGAFLCFDNQSVSLDKDHHVHIETAKAVLHHARYRKTDYLNRLKMLY